MTARDRILAGILGLLALGAGWAVISSIFGIPVCRNPFAMTQSHVAALEVAVRTYESTYGDLPLAGSPSDFFRILSGSSRRGIRFLEPDSVKNGKFTDGWGRELHIVLDTNGDGVIQPGDRLISGTSYPYEPVKKSVAVWSDGPNRKDEQGRTAAAGGDDINNWTR